MKTDKTMLVIDDEDAICSAFEKFFSARGWHVYTAASARTGQETADRQKPAVVFLDVRLPDCSGMKILDRLAAGGASVIVITAYGGLDTAVSALQGKACDYLTKPLDLDKALALAERIFLSHNTVLEISQHDNTDKLLIGQSAAMQEVYKRIAQAAATDIPVLIQGETGTGKELVARAIHRFSDRRDGPFVAINCGAIPENLIESELFGHLRGAFTGATKDRAGRFESADGGTLLLDEISELPPAAQTKLLRVLDTGEVEPVGSSGPMKLNVRIMAATNRDLGEGVQNGQFREDLYYRLAVLRIMVPPLRERKSDIPLLAAHFLGAQATGTPTISDDAIAKLVEHDWPGNVRELRNILAHATATAPDRNITAVDLPELTLSHPTDSLTAEQHLKLAVLDCIQASPESQRYNYVVATAERVMIIHALEHCRGNQSEAANYLGMHRNTLRNKLRELNIRPPR